MIIAPWTACLHDMYGNLFQAPQGDAIAALTVLLLLNLLDHWCLLDICVHVSLPSRRGPAGI